MERRDTKFQPNTELLSNRLPAESLRAWRVNLFHVQETFRSDRTLI